MDRESVRSRLNRVFHRVFENDSIKIYDAMTARDLEEWDSINHINLIVAAEKDFKVSFTTKEVQSLKNVGEFINLILRKLS